MNVFDDYTHDVLEKCIQNNVQFLIVGGYAVNFYGFERTTGDIDLWIKPDNHNKINIINALKDLGIEENTLAQLMQMDFTKHLVFSDGIAPFKIDFMTHISGVSFEEAYPQKTITEIDELKVPFIHLQHLIISKIGTGRPKDSIDIDQLQKISQIKNSKKS